MCSARVTLIQYMYADIFSLTPSRPHICPFNTLHEHAVFCQSIHYSAADSVARFRVSGQFLVISHNTSRADALSRIIIHGRGWFAAWRCSRKSWCTPCHYAAQRGWTMLTARSYTIPHDEGRLPLYATSLEVFKYLDLYSLREELLEGLSLANGGSGLQVSAGEPGAKPSLSDYVYIQRRHLFLFGRMMIPLSRY